MAIKIISNFLLMIGLCVLQVSLISALPGWLSGLNLVLVVLIFILGFSRLNFVVWWSVGIGLLMEVFSFLPYGAYLISFSLTAVIAYFLLGRFFTNRSLYSFLALAALATFFYKIIFNFYILIFAENNQPIFLATKVFWLSILEQISVNLILTFVVYYLMHYLGKNLTSAFLIKNLKY